VCTGVAEAEEDLRTKEKVAQFTQILSEHPVVEEVPAVAFVEKLQEKGDLGLAGLLKNLRDVLRALGAIVWCLAVAQIVDVRQGVPAVGPAAFCV
jgi:hypothetical protein